MTAQIYNGNQGRLNIVNSPPPQFSIILEHEKQIFFEERETY